MSSSGIIQVITVTVAIGIVIWGVTFSYRAKKNSDCSLRYDAIIRYVIALIVMKTGELVAKIFI